MSEKKPSKPATTVRRKPTQERSQNTIEMIFKATAQVLEEHGELALSTNKIAQKAGFSVGTLYQYFPTKEAILLAMISRERERVLQRFTDLLLKSEQTTQNTRGLIADLIHILVEAFATGRGTNRSMIRVAWQMDSADAITLATREASDRLAIFLSRMAEQPGASSGTLKLRASPAALFVVTRAVMGAIRSASLEKSSLLGSPEFEVELVRLAWAMITEN